MRLVLIMAAFCACLMGCKTTPPPPPPPSGGSVDVPGVHIRWSGPPKPEEPHPY